MHNAQYAFVDSFFPGSPRCMHSYLHFELKQTDHSGKERIGAIERLKGLLKSQSAAMTQVAQCHNREHGPHCLCRIASAGILDFVVEPRIAPCITQGALHSSASMPCSVASRLGSV